MDIYLITLKQGGGIYKTAYHDYYKATEALASRVREYVKEGYDDNVNTFVNDTTYRKAVKLTKEDDVIRLSLENVQYIQ